MRESNAARSKRIREQKKYVKQKLRAASAWQIDVIANLSRTQFAIWKAMQQHGASPMCRSCLSDQLGSGVNIGNNGSGPLRDLRQRGIEITNGSRKSGCKNHKGNTTWQVMVSPLPDPTKFKSRALYTEKEARVIRNILSNRDSYTGSSGKSHEIDHRVPVYRLSGVEAKVDVQDRDAVIDAYQLLTPSHNSHKREICKRCVQSGKRAGFLGVPFWFVGEEKYDKSTGCDGCGWAYPEKWKSEVLRLLSEIKADLQGE